MRVRVTTDVDFELEPIINGLELDEMISLWKELTRGLEWDWLALWCPNCKEWRRDGDMDDDDCCLTCDTKLLDADKCNSHSLVKD